MKTATLASAFAETRKKSHLSMLAVANKCDIAETTVWKIEHGRSVRWETVHLAIVGAFRIAPDSPEYRAFQDLWVRHRQEMAAAQAPEHGTKRMAPHVVSAVRAFRGLIHDLDPDQVKRVMAAARRAAR
jgi:transcriptional regulator with XRE-family HTH domain